MRDSARRSNHPGLQRVGAGLPLDMGSWQATDDDHILPARSRRAGRLRRAFVWCVLAVAVAAGLWIVPDDRMRDPHWVAERAAAMASASVLAASRIFQRVPDAATAPGASASARIDAPPTPAAGSRFQAEAAAAEAMVPPPSPLISEPPADRMAGAEAAPSAPVGGPAVPYAAPFAEPPDPLRQRAEAAGLHPDISRVLLARLTEADFQNAAVAIRTALAETADDSVLFWPRKRSADLALFQVHFVPGAAPTCRRYVVTIAKDRWATTALPIEKCSLPSVRPPSSLKG